MIEQAIVIIDPKHPIHNKFKFAYKEQWKEVYGEVEEELPNLMPNLKEKFIMKNVFVDASHAQDLVSRRSVTGVSLF